MADSQAKPSLTLTTTDTDIRAGEAVDIDIASDIDITGFTASDITVTGGTRGALTGSGMSWTLSVTAGTAGTMTVAIAEDAVSPGNTAVSQTFTVTAEDLVATTLDRISGNNQSSVVSTALSNPFVVEVQGPKWRCALRCDCGFCRDRRRRHVIGIQV